MYHFCLWILRPLQIEKRAKRLYFIQRQILYLFFILFHFFKFCFVGLFLFVCSQEFYRWGDRSFFEMKNRLYCIRRLVTHQTCTEEMPIYIGYIVQWDDKSDIAKNTILIVKYLKCYYLFWRNHYASDVVMWYLGWRCTVSFVSRYFLHLNSLTIP